MSLLNQISLLAVLRLFVVATVKIPRQQLQPCGGLGGFWTSGSSETPLCGSLRSPTLMHLTQPEAFNAVMLLR